MIFQRVVPPSFLLDSSTSPGPQSSWCKTLRQKKAIVRVCKLWYKTGISFLYEDVCIRRVGHASIFLRTLENTNINLGDFVKKLTIFCLIPKSYCGTFSLQLQHIFELSPRISHFSYTSPCRLPIPDVLPAMVGTIRHLTLSNAIQFPTLISLLSQLSTELISLSFHVPVIDHGLWTTPHLTFPKLETLVCGVTPYGRRYLGFIATNWVIPSLQRLTLKLNGNPINWEPCILMGDFSSFCAIHGRQLKFLHIHPEYWWSMAKYSINVQMLLDACPMLEHLVLHPNTAPPPTHPGVKWVDVWAPHVRSDCAVDWRKLYLNLTLQHFPALKGVRVLFAALASLPDLPTNIPPGLVLSDNDSFEFRFLDLCIRHDRGKVYTIEPEWAEDEEDAGSDGSDLYVYSSDDGCSTSTSDSASGSDSEDDSQEDCYIERDWDADPDILSDIYYPESSEISN
ncbi:hypothetical protein BDQ12DRAFT_672776 [Crucibulum laeve]|uniref:F-box domain-containing protein n=1 Tax=Crucibulum laeve TaxID=68775 RepID=A0A5C3MGF0_9AGAR|nr:hypothetical protein BDQ12DRAFT_672776 [Crucibulum laeve]